MGTIRWLVTGIAAAGLLGPVVLPGPAGLAPAVASAAPAWSVVPSPDATAPQGQFSGVSCASATACIAVGSTVDQAGAKVALAERWNGTTWTVQNVPRPAGAMTTSLSAVSCTSATACTAVGHYGVTDLTLAERWNGMKWAIQSTPNPVTGSYLLGVSCTSATACTAVGYYRDVPALVTLAERWNGTTWVIEQTPNATGYDELTAVSCTSARACTAVGWATAGRRFPTLAERWNGTIWTVQPTRSPPGQDALSAVSCPSATACTAVGYSTVRTQDTLAERWNGTRWALQPTPRPAGNGELSGVWCASATACTAVGLATGSQSSTETTLAEAWNGTTWTIQPTPRRHRGQFMSLAAVSCLSATACMAAGYNGAASGLTLAEAWNGTAWATQRTPSPAGAQSSVLTAISCTSATACTAVGNATDNAELFGDVTLAERWDGTRWAFEPTPGVPGAVTGYLAASILSAVSCTSATACMAVGYYEARKSGSEYLDGLAERWNGTKWAVQPLPISSEFSPLTGISCPSATSCTAVGTTLENKSPHDYQVLAERWNGTKWAVEPAPSPAGDVTMGGVSCLSATACTLAGSYQNSSLGQSTLAERWNGTKWTVQPTPNAPGSTDSYLSGVSCPSARSCTAAGWASGTKSGIVRVTLAERWNGAKWTIQPTPNQKQSITELTGVSCASATSCTAVGSFTRLLVEAWSGSTWAFQSPAMRPGLFSGVSCTPAGPCTAVGNSYTSLGSSHTLVERRS